MKIIKTTTFRTKTLTYGDLKIGDVFKWVQNPEPVIMKTEFAAINLQNGAEIAKSGYSQYSEVILLKNVELHIGDQS